MTSRELSGEEVAAALERLGYTYERETDRHAVLKYRNPVTDKVTMVTVPLVERLAPMALRNVADQAGATVDFEAFLARVEDALDAA